MLGLQLPTADEVSFWTSPEKTGFMFSQGEHIKNWRRRWFILKQGYLFRFATADVSATSKPKGVVDLSKVTDVSSGRETTGRNNSIKLSTVGATVSYICDSETEQVEWMSAIETAVAKIVKQVRHCLPSLSVFVFQMYALCAHASHASQKSHS